MSESQRIRVVLSNISPPDAPRLARQLVEERLAACVNIIPGVRSFYRWQGKLYDDMECTLLCKTTEAGLPALTERLREIHPYELPEIITLEVTGGLPAYLEWVAGSVG